MIIAANCSPISGPGFVLTPNSSPQSAAKNVQCKIYFVFVHWWGLDVHMWHSMSCISSCKAHVRSHRLIIPAVKRFLPQVSILALPREQWSEIAIKIGWWGGAGECKKQRGQLPEVYSLHLTWTLLWWYILRHSVSRQPRSLSAFL